MKTNMYTQMELNQEAMETMENHWPYDLETSVPYNAAIEAMIEFAGKKVNDQLFKIVDQLAAQSKEILQSADTSHALGKADGLIKAIDLINKQIKENLK